MIDHYGFSPILTHLSRIYPPHYPNVVILVAQQLTGFDMIQTLTSGSLVTLKWDNKELSISKV